MTYPLPPAFVDSLSNILPADERQALLAAFDTPAPTSIRFNPYKISQRPEGNPVPWSRYGFYLDERPLFTVDPLFHGGAYYVQEASSMFLERIFRAAFPEEGQSLKILDLCAAPGGKTTHLAALAGLESTVVANEVIRPRAKILSENVQKWGLGNVVVTSNDPSHFSSLTQYFDLIVVDAPCSGEGMFRKTPEARAEWTPANVQLCAARQQRILTDAWGALRKGGVLIYSTCTFNRTENEENVAWLAGEHNCEAVHVDTADLPGVVRGEAGGIETFRFFPHRITGEGFFAAVFRKGGNPHKEQNHRFRKAALSDLPKAARMEVASWCDQPEYMRFGALADGRVFGYYGDTIHDVNLLADRLSLLHSGIEMGQLMNGKLKPEASLALFHGVSRERAPEADLELVDALRYLRKDEVAADRFAEGINLVTFQGLPLGWIKRIGHRSNNLFPKEWRIMNH